MFSFSVELASTGSMGGTLEAQEWKEWLWSYLLLLWCSWSARYPCSSLQPELPMFNPAIAPRFLQVIQFILFTRWTKFNQSMKFRSASLYIFFCEMKLTICYSYFVRCLSDPCRRALEQRWFRRLAAVVYSANSLASYLSILVVTDCFWCSSFHLDVTFLKFLMLCLMFCLSSSEWEQWLLACSM